MIHVSVGKPYFDARIPDRQNLLLWKDDLTWGPVPRTETLPELSRIRDAFWNVPWASRKISVSSAARDRHFSELNDAIAIWCGDNRRDALMSAAVLRFLDKEIPVQIVPCGGTRGVGACGPDECAVAYESRQPLTEPMRDDLLQLWEAYTAKDPTSLCKLSGKSSIAGRILEEYPAADTGLSHLEETLLANITDGMSAVWAVAETCSSLDEPIGDLTLFDLLWELVHYHPPLLELVAPVADFRSAKLRKCATAPLVIRPRWIGGVEIKGDDFPWRYDRQRRILDKV